MTNRSCLLFLLFLAVVSAIPYDLNPEISQQLLAYYRFTERPVSNGVLKDSSTNHKDGVYKESIPQRWWHIGGDMDNQGLRLNSNSFRTQGLTIPRLTLLNGFSVGFIYEPSTALTTQTILFANAVQNSQKRAIEILLSQKKIVFGTSIVSTTLTTQTTFIPEVLYHVVLTIQPAWVRVYVNGKLDAEIAIPPRNWLNSYDLDIVIGRNPTTSNTQLQGFFDELIFFGRAISDEEVRHLFSSVLRGDILSCTQPTLAVEDFSTYPEGANLNGLGKDQATSCQWSSGWGTPQAIVSNSSLMFRGENYASFANRFLSISEVVASATFSARVLDLCRVIDPSESMNDLYGYCRRRGKTIALNLCSFDNYCITFGIATELQKFFYRCGFTSDEFTILGNIERPIVNSFPNGVYLKFEISSDSFLTFSYGADQSSMQVLDSHVPFSSPWPLSNMNLFRVVSVSADFEPGAKFSDISLSYQFIPDAPISCDSGYYLSGPSCRSCPVNSTSPIGSTNKQQCICRPGLHLDSCTGQTNCEGFRLDEFEYSSFSGSGFTFFGSAQLSQTNSVLLTPSKINQSGQFFHSSSVNLRSFSSPPKDISFSAHFVFLINANGPISDIDGQGADGMAFIMTDKIQESSNGGGGLGYGGITPSVVLEFDTFYNTANGDKDGNHIGINLNGFVQSQVQKNIPTRLNNGNPWHCWVDYDATHELLEVRLSQTMEKPQNPELSYHISLSSTLGSSMYMGFTAATGSAYSAHYLLFWEFYSSTPDSCTDCPKNTYKSTYGNEDCTSCPYASTTNTVKGATSIEQCLCLPGYHKVDGECETCPVDTFTMEYGQECKPCPPFSSTLGEVGKSICTCQDGFFMNATGCQDVNECEEIDPCFNDGICHNEYGTYICICPPEWTGKYCERDVDECFYDPCWNQGTCTNTPGSFECSCPPNWQGDLCEIDVNECEDSPCSPQANCTNTIGSFFCYCQDGLIGTGFECHVSVGPQFIEPEPTEIFGRLVLIKWTPEDYYDAHGYIIEVDFEPFSPSFEVGHQDYTDGSATQFILDNLPPLTRMRIRIRGFNMFGTSPASNFIELSTTEASPDPCVLAFDEGLLLWKPGNSNGATITGFLIQVFQDFDNGTAIKSENVGPSETRLDVKTFLLPKISYYLTITTLSSDYGNSEASNSVLVYFEDVKPTSKPTVNPPNEPESPSDGLTSGAVAGIVIFLIVCILAIGVLLYFFVFKRNTSGRIRLEDDSKNTGLLDPVEIQEEGIHGDESETQTGFDDADDTDAVDLEDNDLTKE